MMKRTKRTLLTGLSLAVLAGALLTSTAPVEASTAGVKSVPTQAAASPNGGPIYWWVDAGAALLGGAVGGAVAGGMGGPGGAVAGAAAGGVGGLVGYVVSSLFGVHQASPMHPSAELALD